MEKLSIAVCDDEPAILELFTRLISKCFAYHNVSTEIEKFTSPVRLTKVIKERDFDLLFLDIDMPKIDGISLAKSLRKVGYDMDIIYVSSKEEQVFKVFDVQPYSFIRKNHFFDEIAGVVRSYVKSRSNDNQRFVINQTSGGVVSVDLNKTMYFEGEGKYQNIFLFNRDPIQIRYRMSELEERLFEAGFIRVHKGYLVNYQYIDSIEDNNIFLTTGAVIPISRRKLNDVKERYLNLMKWDRNIVG